jgi:hypothetical protein
MSSRCSSRERWWSGEQRLPSGEQRGNDRIAWAQEHGQERDGPSHRPYHVHDGEHQRRNHQQADDDQIERPSGPMIVFPAFITMFGPSPPINH